MAKNEKKVSISSLDRVIKDNFTNKNILEWRGLELTLKHSLSFTEMLEFVNNVVMSCFQDNGGFMPEVMDFAIKNNILSKYANFSLPDKLDHRYEIIYNSDAVDFVCQNINMQQLHEITKSIDRKISYLCDTNVINIQKQMMELVSAFENVQRKTSDMFANFTPEDLTKIMGALDDGGLDGAKIVKSYLEQTKPADPVDDV